MPWKGYFPLRIQTPMDYPGNPVFHQFFPEIQQVAEFATSELQVGEKLFLMRRMDLLHRLQLDDDLLV